MRIDQLGEFGLIDRINNLLPKPGKDVLVGIGDDVAVLRSQPDKVWLATCDIQVENVHFLRQAITPSDLGHKALAINLSDIAAKGGTPRYALISLGLPNDLPIVYIDELYAGLKAEAAPFNVDIIGGNISNSKLGLFVDITLLGEADPDHVLLRSGARPGDLVLVTGSLGDAAAGVALELNPRLAVPLAYKSVALRRRDRPTPRVREGQLIAASGKATAMMDISDGLAGDVNHICERSQVGVRLYADRLPVARENRILSAADHGDEWYYALHGGEDYELVFTVPANEAEALSLQLTQQTGTPVASIGEIIPAKDGQQLVLPDGKNLPLQARGWDHFKEAA